MKKKEISHIIHNYFLELKKSFRVIEKDTSPDTIKPFRIEIKKLRAFLRLLSLEIKDPDQLKLDGALKEMHKSGGRFRDLQLHRQRIMQVIKNKPGTRFSPELLGIGVKQIREEKKDFLSQKGFIKTEKKIMGHIPDHYNTATVKKFFRSRLGAIREIIAAGCYSDKEMHDIRKKLKDILYIIKLYSAAQEKPLGFRFWNKAELEQAKTIEDQLGFLNDTRNALLLLTPSDINPFKGEEKKLLLQVKRGLLAEKRKLKKQVLVSLRELNLEKP